MFARIILDSPLFFFFRLTFDISSLGYHILTSNITIGLLHVRTFPVFSRPNARHRVPRAEPEPEGGLSEEAGGGEGGRHAAPPAPLRRRRHPLQHERHQRQPRGTNGALRGSSGAVFCGHFGRFGVDLDIGAGIEKKRGE